MKCAKPLNHRSSAKESGAILVLVAGALIPLIACFALALDGFRWMSAKVEQDNIAEYAALSALEEYRYRGVFVAHATKASEAITKASNAAKSNAVIGSVKEGVKTPAMMSGDAFGDVVGGPLSGSFIQFGMWNPAAVPGSRFTPANASGCPGNDCNAVRVFLKMTAANRLSTLLASVIRIRHLEATSNVYAYCDETLPSNENPYRIVHQ